MTPSRPAISIIIPCFNEAGRLPASLRQILAYFDGRGELVEILIVDDGSSDHTSERAAEAAGGDPRVRLLGYSPNRGKGFAVAYGAARAAGRLVLFSDADLSTPIAEVEKLRAVLGPSCSVAIGSRGLSASDLRVRQPLWREACGKLMNRLIRFLSGLPFPDTQCGFKLFTAEAAAAIFPNLSVGRWMFDVEVLVLARKLGFGVRDVGVTWVNSGESRVRLSHAPSILAELIHIRRHWFRREPALPTASLKGDADSAGR